MRRLAVLLSAVILASLAPLAPLAPVVPGCAAAGSDHAALAVEHSDGSIVTRCVAFNADTISGEELLNKSGVAWSSQTFSSFGDAVCALDGEPARYVDCLGKDSYWALFVSRGGGPWQLSSVGISSLTLGNGDAEGFRYVPASGVPAAPVSAAGVCVAAAATPTATPSRRPFVTAITATAPPTAGSTTITTEPPASGVAPTATATTSGAATASATAPPQVPTPAPSGGADLGLMAAAVAGGGLAGLALLRLFAVRARPR